MAFSRPEKNGTSALALIKRAISKSNAVSAFNLFRMTDWKLEPSKSSLFARAHSSSVDIIERYEEVMTSLGSRTTNTVRMDDGSGKIAFRV